MLLTPCWCENFADYLDPATGLHGGFGAVAVAERLEEHPDLAAVMVFVVGGGDTRLVAHAVVPAPDEWPTDKPSAWLIEVGFWLTRTGPDPMERRRRLTTATQLTTRIIRAVTRGELERWARQVISADDSWAVLGMSPGGDRKHRTQHGGGDRRLAALAARYVELLVETDAPNPMLADEFGISINTVSSYLFRARERGLLTSPGRGRPGGALTARARQLMTDTEGS